MSKLLQALFVLILIIFTAHADSITHGSTTINMEFVNIGYEGNMADSTGYGAVGYNYRIGKLEVTIDQFMKARAVDSRISNGNEDYWNDGIHTVGINAPASKVTWYEATMFANWLTTGDAYMGVYQFDGGGTLTGLDRSCRNGNDMAYVLPTEDEWYKAAYYKPINDGSYSLYASGLDSTPVQGTTDGWNYNGVLSSPNVLWETGYGAEEQNGTFDMNGNVYEWNESASDGTLDDMEELRVIRGGAGGDTEDILRSSTRLHDYPSNELNSVGFRVVAIPEPSSVVLMGMAGVFTLLARKKTRR
ncbi:MAG: hypothetical protein DRP64_09015 [Verrucomicrobia bacterium]|nr:MAG: hypothetical protein DRP64_09015 [Verrucomicrobiota bacterium]